MKVNVLLVLGVFLVLGIGPVCADSPMNLTGKWIQQTIEGFRYSGESLNSSATDDYWTLTQNGNLVSGTNYFNDSTKLVQEPVAGSISPDEKIVYIVDSSGGTYIAHITDEDTLMVNYINTGTKKAESNYAFALYQVLKREK
ncbi:hypothetical protein [Methanospirillum lacunae]|uniref:Lipocalin-like domain-containing protein n=1 Tax=Methanospirillum lacunae TaxID=668570 RepID=A0A2V2NHB2_9EURY|nr:hypothetical protein [Methanospirillum lacunae]PWR74723.1 hypothetical protein DK846_00280 [Methanospirillum lacunae]